MQYKVQLKRLMPMYKVMFVEAENVSEARRLAFELDDGTGYLLKVGERKRRYITSLEEIKCHSTGKNTSRSMET